MAALFGALINKRKLRAASRFEVGSIREHTIAPSIY
jgi:hypothetical protein